MVFSPSPSPSLRPLRFREAMPLTPSPALSLLVVLTAPQPPSPPPSPSPIAQKLTPWAASAPGRCPGRRRRARRAPAQAQPRLQRRETSWRRAKWLPPPKQGHPHYKRRYPNMHYSFRRPCNANSGVSCAAWACAASPRPPLAQPPRRPPRIAQSPAARLHGHAAQGRAGDGKRQRVKRRRHNFALSPSFTFSPFPFSLFLSFVPALSVLLCAYTCSGGKRVGSLIAQPHRETQLLKRAF